MLPIPPEAEKAQRLHLDPIRCAAFGFCAEFAPELFGLDEWGYAWRRQQELPASLASLAEEAARLCPKRAIFLERLVHSASPRQRAAQLKAS